MAVRVAAKPYENRSLDGTVRTDLQFRLRSHNWKDELA
jgi:hypothetical protein